MIDARTEQMIWLSGGDPLILEKYKQITMIEYYQILDAKIGQIKKQEKGNFGNKH